MRHPILRAALTGMRQNLLPGAVLWVVALTVVGSYYAVPAMRPWFERIATAQQRGGYWFSGISTAISGAILPFLALALLGRLPARGRGRLLVFLLVVWVYRGMEVDTVYRLQARLFGEGTDVATVVKKVLVDQFIYSAFWTGPTSMLLYRWKDCGFSWAATRASLDRDTFRVQLPAVVMSLWSVWIPAVSIIYCLPSALQVPLFSLVLCFWVLLLEAVATRETEAAVVAAA